MRRRALSLRSQEFPASSGRWNFCRSTRFIPDSPRHPLSTPIRSLEARRSFADTPAIALTDRGAINGATALEETDVAG
jgi:hypothetical protein